MNWVTFVDKLSLIRLPSRELVCRRQVGYRLPVSVGSRSKISRNRQRRRFAKYGGRINWTDNRGPFIFQFLPKVGSLRQGADNWTTDYIGPVIPNVCSK